MNTRDSQRVLIWHTWAHTLRQRKCRGILCNTQSLSQNHRKTRALVLQYPYKVPTRVCMCVYRISFFRVFFRAPSDDRYRHTEGTHSELSDVQTNVCVCAGSTNFMRKFSAQIMHTHHNLLVSNTTTLNAYKCIGSARKLFENHTIGLYAWEKGIKCVACWSTEKRCNMNSVKEYLCCSFINWQQHFIIEWS